MNYKIATIELAILIKEVLTETKSKKISREKLRNLWKKKFPITSYPKVKKSGSGTESSEILGKVFKELDEQKIIKRYKYPNSQNEGYIIVIDVKKLIDLCCQ